MKEIKNATKIYQEGIIERSLTRWNNLNQNVSDFISIGTKSLLKLQN